MNQTFEVLMHLKKYGSITPMEALREHHSFRLSSIIHRLRKEGREIRTELVDGKENRYARYHLEEK